MSNRLTRSLVGAAAGLALGAVLGFVIIPLLTQQWLFSTSAGNIRRVSGPTLIVLGLWLGALLGAVRQKRGVEPSHESVLWPAAGLRVTVSAIAVLFATGLWLEFAPATVHQLIAVFFTEPVPSFAPLWLLLVNAIAAITAALWLHLLARRDRPHKEQSAAVPERGLWVFWTFWLLAVCLVAGWLFVKGGWFGLIWAI